MKTRRKLNSIFNQVVDKFTLQEDKTSKIDPKLKKELMIKFKPEVVKLNELLHKEGFVEKDFDLLQYWGYDKI